VKNIYFTLNKTSAAYLAL